MRDNNKIAGQTVVILMIFITISIVIISAAVILVISNTAGAAIGQQSVVVRELAENGVENALLRLLRDPSYTGETMIDGDTTTIISVTGDNTNKIIVSEGIEGNFDKKIRVKISYNSIGELIVNSYEDIQL